MAKKKYLPQKKAPSLIGKHKNLRWLFPLLVIVIICFLFATFLSGGNNQTFYVSNKSENENVSASKINLSFWEEDNIESENSSASPELIKDLKTILGPYPHKTELSSSDVETASVVKDVNTSKYIVAVTFTPTGKLKLLDITKRNLGKSIAIAIDNKIVNVVMVYMPVSIGTMQIGGFTGEEADKLANNFNPDVTTQE